jgi:hypothetical protein
VAELKSWLLSSDIHYPEESGAFGLIFDTHLIFNRIKSNLEIWMNRIALFLVNTWTF